MLNEINLIKFFLQSVKTNPMVLILLSIICLLGLALFGAIKVASDGELIFIIYAFLAFVMIIFLFVLLAVLKII